MCICKPFVGLVIVSVLILPFSPSSTKAQQIVSPSSCELQLYTLSPQVVSCVSLKVEIRAGKSNLEIENEIYDRGIQKNIRATDIGRSTQSENGKSVSKIPSTASVDQPSENVQRLYPSPGQCYTFAVEFTKRYDLVGYGLARNVPISSADARVGAIVITKESKAGHLAVVTEMDETTITVIERNYLVGWVTTRKINKNAWFIRGYN